MSCSVFSTTLSLMQMFNDKIDEYVEDIKTDHMVWLEEIQQEATCMFSSEFSAEPELMPKTPSQKKSTRRKRVSLGRDASRVKRRFSKGKRSNLRRFSVTSSLNLIPEDAPKSPASEVFTEEPKRNTRRNKQVQSEEDARPPSRSGRKAAQNSVPDGEEPESAPSAPSTSHTPPQILEAAVKISAGERESAEMRVSRSPPQTSSTSHPPPPIPMLEAAVRISAGERKSAEKLMAAEPSPGRTATKITIAGSAARSSRRSSVRHSLTVRRSLAGLRHSMTQESVRRASRRSFLKMKARMGSSTCSSNVSDVVVVSDEEEEVEEKAEGLSEQPAGAEVQTDMGNTEALPDVKEEKSPVVRLTRSRAQNTPVMTATASIINKDKCGTPDSGSDGSGKKLQSNSTSSLRTRPTAKRKAADATEDFLSPRKKASPPKKSQTAIRPAMRSFLHTVQKNQLLMMTPSSTGRTNVMKSFIKHTTPLRVDIKERERLKLEALKKKQEQEEERKRKMEEEKKRKQEELKRKRDERLRKVVEARIKEEQRDEEKKKKIEQKMAQIDEKNDKLRVERLAEEKAKKVASTKRQEELEQRRKLEEEARRKKIQQAEEEKRLQEEQQAKRRVEEEQERVRRLAEARRALELKKEQEREIERERQAAAEREREEREKALALQREVEKALRDKERRELDEWRKREEEQQKRVEEERAARLREVKQKEAAAALAAAQSAPSVDQHSLKKAPGFNITVDIESSLMKTPVGKGPGFNATIDIEQSPQSYDLTPKGGNKPVVVSSNPEDYGMDQNSDDSTDDEQAPRKPIPSWAVGVNLKQSIKQQYFNPLDLHAHFGDCEPPKLENIFFKSKPRYFKRTSSAVWHSPPLKGTLPF